MKTGTQILGLFWRSVVVSMVIIICILILQYLTREARQGVFRQLQAQQVSLQQARVLLVSSNNLDPTSSDYSNTLATIHQQLSLTLSALHAQSIHIPFWYGVSNPFRSFQIFMLQQKTHAMIEDFEATYQELHIFDQSLAKIFEYSAENDLGRLDILTQKNDVARRIEAMVGGLQSLEKQHPQLSDQVLQVITTAQHLKADTQISQRTYQEYIATVSREMQELQKHAYTHRKKKAQEIFIPILIDHTTLVRDLRRLTEE